MIPFAIPRFRSGKFAGWRIVIEKVVSVKPKMSLILATPEEGMD